MSSAQGTRTEAHSAPDDAFGALVEQHRRELHLHCYRMLGSLDDADDLLQETLLAAWRGLADFDGRASLRTWLFRIATNRCLNAIRNGRRRPPSAPVPPFEPPPPTRAYDVGWLQPYPDRLLDPARRHESRADIELAFIAALQRLPPRQTAAVLLVDVLGFEATEAARMLDIGPTALKGLMQRARAGLPAEPGPVGPVAARESRLASRFADAFAADDVDAVVALLTDDAWLAMPPAPQQYVGGTAVAAFLRASASGRGGRLTLLPTAANLQPAFGCYLAAAPAGVVVLTIDPEPGRISAITRFLDPSLHRRFGLPETL
ncbi:RNA polymerase subunit sigma-70 [Microlunatus sp. Gsoil 973]|uniref:RNA polymerase subunit sigma-70 n=1 Tax=Microlunatus sp. Gsoil 973 TaxID=2672569 RepID=UPI0012B4D7F0|nr:RNA polymerase subunit sigma-70 [Microlunatus sp. Gsoil 973]QGN34584.1 sigma-70 family RNA polymerase sigma factor [Microlunatus sp. Gsoil 973]